MLRACSALARTRARLQRLKRARALRGAQVSSDNRTLAFLANVDPEDVSRALKGKNPETTLVIVVRAHTHTRTHLKIHIDVHN